jgi:hypothetical protein
VAWRNLTGGGVALGGFREIWMMLWVSSKTVQ